jgi:hypothetical protein
MLEVVGKANLDKARPSRLLGCSFARLVWHLLGEELGRPSVEIVENFVEGKAAWADLRREFVRIRRDTPPLEVRERAVYHLSVEVLMMFSISAGNAREVARQSAEASRSSGGKDLTVSQCNLVREIFGNLFSPDPFDSAWVTSTAIALAMDINNNRAFDAMPILGDALEEAGCPSPSILDHCRGKNHHVRGCWVVDGVLGYR